MTSRSSCFLALAAIIVLSGCALDWPEVSVAQKARSECPASDAGDYYFEVEAFSDVRREDDGRRRTASWLLASMKQPLLSCGPAHGEVYRFLWAHSFAHWRPTMVTITGDRNQWRLAGIQLTGLVDHTRAASIDRTLSADESRMFLAAIDRSAFWQTQYRLKHESEGDTYNIVFEGRRDTGYHVRGDQRMPGGATGDLYRTMLQLAEFRLFPE